MDSIGVQSSLWRHDEIQVASVLNCKYHSQRECSLSEIPGLLIDLFWAFVHEAVPLVMNAIDSEESAK